MCAKELWIATLLSRACPPISLIGAVWPALESSDLVDSQRPPGRSAYDLHGSSASKLTI